MNIFRFLDPPVNGHYGWIPQRPDKRDIRYDKLVDTSTLPKTADLRPICPPIQNQGELGSCTAHALTGALEVLELKDKHPLKMLSRLFVYYNERAMEGTIQSDAGAALRDGIKCLNKQGACLEALWPYNIDRFRQKPNQNCYNNAQTHDIVDYKSLNSLSDMKSCLAYGYPFVFGFTVYESFESPEVATSGDVPIPNFTTEHVLGGHAVLGVGYDDNTKKVLVRNSWGTSWGINGYFWLPYDYINDPDLASDFWTIQKTKSE